MARNRKRAKERRARRPQPVASRSREAAARGGVPERLERADEAPETLEPVGPEPLEELEPPVPEPAEDEEPDYEAPPPLEHAAPDAEIADAQVELGAVGQLDGLGELEDDQAHEEPRGRVYEDERDEDEGDGRQRRRAGELTMPAGVAAERRALPGNRLINFLQGSWRELQRVQWPDRRQVMQATGVVIGFVIVAGVFLGVSDWVAGKVVNFVINGHF